MIVGMALQATAQLAQCHHVVVMQPSQQVICCINHGRNVSFREKEPILRVIFGIVVIVFHST